MFSSDLIGIFEVTLQQLKEMEGLGDFPVSLIHFFMFIYLLAI